MLDTYSSLSLLLDKMELARILEKDAIFINETCTRCIILDEKKHGLTDKFIKKRKTRFNRFSKSYHRYLTQIGFLSSDSLDQFPVFFVKQKNKEATHFIWKSAFVFSTTEKLLEVYEVLFEDFVFQDMENLAQTSLELGVEHSQFLKSLKSNVFINFLKIENKDHRADIRKVFSILNKNQKRLEKIFLKGKDFASLYEESNL